MEQLLEKNIRIEENELNLTVSDVIAIAATPKRERSFYLLNKLVGNHLEVKPNIIRAVGSIMAGYIYISPFDTKLLVEYIKGNEQDEEKVNSEIQKYIEPNENVFVIGLAKSATAIGMATAAAIKGSYYISTTRETSLDIEPLFSFEESHTLITTHKCYLKDKLKLQEAERIIIVEDEITTGNTMINLIKEISPLTRAKTYSIVTILNFSNSYFSERLDDLEKELNIKIEVKQMIKGHLDLEELNRGTCSLVKDGESEEADEIQEICNIEKTNEFEKEGSKLTNGILIEMMSKSGSFGVSFDEIQQIEKKAQQIAKTIKNDENVLIIGYGENMYVPSRIGYYMSNKAFFKSITQNKIITNKAKSYPIQQCAKCTIHGMKYYLYNKEKIEKEYDEVYFIVDTDIDLKLTKNTRIIKL